MKPPKTIKDLMIIVAIIGLLLMTTSTAYRQASRREPPAVNSPADPETTDPGNQLLCVKRSEFLFAE